jgi:UDP-glucose 4-epimerase
LIHQSALSHGLVLISLGGNRDGDVPDLTADPKLAHEELGWKAENTLETMCKDLWNWQSQNPQGKHLVGVYDGTIAY